jgi:hypothetical protein
VINFDAIVLNVCEDIFSIAIKVTLTASKPEAAPIICRGIYSSGPVDAIMQDETIFSDQQTSIGIRLRDFEIPPDRGDLIEIIDARHPAYGLRYWVGDSDLDGQGGAMLLLRTEYP